MTYSEQMTAVIGRLRRKISDTDTLDFTYQDEDLYNYISDAVEELEAGAYSKSYEVSNGDFILTSDGITPAELTSKDINVYLIQAHIIITQALKSQADRENFALRKNGLTVDTTMQSANHDNTLKELKQDLSRAIVRATSGIIGTRIE